MIIMMLGAQGTGKGTVAGLISKETNWPQISTGDIFRKNISEKTELGIEADKYISKGNLVPDKITVPMVQNRLKQEDAQEKRKQEQEENKSNMHCPYTHWSMVKLPVASPLKKTESFPTCTPPKPSIVESYTSASLSQFLRVLFDGFLSRLLLLGVGVEVVTEAFYVPLSQL